MTSAARPGRAGARPGRHVPALTAAAVTGIIMAACSPAQNGSVDSANPSVAVVSADSRITMQRLPCFGTCPVYTVEIAADGSVTFSGERWVDSIGTSTARVGPAAAAALMQELATAGFFDLEDRYTHDAKVCGSYHTDAPRVNLTLRVSGREKTVEHDYGCSDAPPVLRVLQERVDSVADVGRWVGRR
jgi:hypothetical protein